ncbi:MAG: A24 family peptidase [Candidatus Hydrogenedentes bacterium]|nr:A24 family peptidase [Candidatus Hydrogenedentota bacterium]
MPLWDAQTLVVQWGVVIGASLAAALWDVRTRRIPNGLTGPLFLAGIAWHVWLGGPAGAVDSALGCFVAALPFLVLFLYAGGGAGDAKMMGAVGAWLGLAHGLVALVAVVCAGALLGLGYAVVKKKFYSVLGYVMGIAMTWIGKVRAGKWRGGIVRPLPQQGELTEMPYALSILSGICIAAIGIVLWQA